MHKRISVFILVICFCLQKILAQNTFCVAIGSPSYDIGYDIVQTFDGGYAVVGYTWGYGAGSTDVYFAKIDDNGNLLFTKTFGGYSSDEGNNILQIDDGGFLISGTSYYFGNDDIFIIKTDKQGIIQWNKIYGGVNYERSVQTIRTTDGGYAILGETTSYGSGLYVLKTDSLGSIQWTRSLSRKSSINDDDAASIVQTSDGGFAITGSSSGNSGNFDLLLIKLNAGGGLEWTKLIGVGGNVDDEGQAIIKTRDGGYAIAGYIDNSIGNMTTYLIKLDSVFTIQWAKQFGGSYYTFSLIQNVQGDFVILSSYGTSKILIKNISENGTLNWVKKITGTNIMNAEWAYKIIQTTDLGYALVGNTFSYGAGSNDVSIMKLDSSGNGCCTEPDSAISASIGTDYLIDFFTDSGYTINTANWEVGNGGSEAVQCTTGCAVPIANAGNDKHICFGSNVVLNGTGGANFSWYPSTALSNSSISHPLASPASTTTYYLVLTNACGSDTDSVTVFVHPEIETALSSDTTICSGKNLVLSASNGDPYLWNTGDTTSSIIVAPETSIVYSVIVYQGLCSDTDSVNVTVLGSPHLQISGDDSLCAGDSSVLIVSGADSFQWSTNEISSTIVVSPPLTDTLVVTGKNSNGCLDSTSVIITVRPYPAAEIIAYDTVICQYEATTLLALGGESYLWNTGDTSSSILINPPDTTLYTLTAINDYCYDTAGILIIVKPAPKIQLSDDTTIFAGDTILLTVGEGTNYLWSTGELNSSIIVSPQSSNDYCVTVIDTSINNCSHTACVSITVEPHPCGIIFIPTIFSPNNDGRNDVFLVKGRCIHKISITIYDRWGQKVFETSELSNGWDGTFNGGALNSDVFVYDIRILRTNDEAIRLKGNITIVK